MRVFGPIRDQEIGPNVQEFFACLKNAAMANGYQGDVAEVEDLQSSDVRPLVRLLAGVEAPVVVVFAHGGPGADELQDFESSFSTKVIHIALSAGSPGLAIASSFDRKVAEFRWLPKAGKELGRLGIAMGQSLSAGTHLNAADLLDTVRTFFKAAFDRDELLAAYLFGKVYEEDSDLLSLRLGEVGIDPKYAEVPLAMLRDALKQSL